MPPWNNTETTQAAKRLAGKSLYTLGSGLCAAGVAAGKFAAAGVQAAVKAVSADHSGRERVTFVRLAEVEWRDSQGRHRRLPVALLGYEAGFQLWSLEGDGPEELLSIRRDGVVRWLEPLPQPREEDPLDGPLYEARPLLAVVSGPAAPTTPTAASNNGREQQQHRVQLYSLRTQGVVRTLGFGSEVLAVLASSRWLVVAVRGSLQAFDAVTLEHTFSCMTHCPPPPRPPSGAGGGQQLQPAAAGGEAAPEGGPLPGAPCALGPRWLAYAADQAVQAHGSQAKAQRLPLHRRDSASGGGLAVPSRSASIDAGALAPAGSAGTLATAGSGPLSGAAVAEAAKEYAKKGGQQLAGLAAAAGSASLKYLTTQYRSFRSGAQQGALAPQSDASVGGTVMVRDVVTRQVVAHFRAHSSPLAALAFTPCGTMLATASTAGHNINLFRIVPPAPAAGGSGFLEGDWDAAGGLGPHHHQQQGGYAVHLFRLHRGVTAATIQGINFAPDASWVVVTSARGTSHVFHLGGQPAQAALLLGGGPSDTASKAAAAAGGGQGAAQQLQLRLEEGVAGQPVKLVAVGKAGGRSGLLGSGIAGAASQAARSVSGQPSEMLPAAAAFLPAKPSSPRGLGTPPLLSTSEAAAPLALVVLNWEGQLTRHLLRTAGAAAAAAAAVAAAGAAANGSVPSAAALEAALQEEARWDICRQHSWQEREEVPPFLLPIGGAAVDIHSNTSALLGSPHANGAAAEGAEGIGSGSTAAAAGSMEDPSWLAQAEGGPLAAATEAGGPGAAPPLWADPQFRFFAVPSPAGQQAQQQQQQPLNAAPFVYEGMLAGSPSDAGGALGRSPTPSSSGRGYLLHGSPALLVNGFGAADCSRPGSSLGSPASEAGPWDGRRQ